MYEEAQPVKGFWKRMYGRYRYYSFPIRWRWIQLTNALTHRLPMWIVWRLPRWVIYFAVIRLWAHGTTGPWDTTHPNELTWDEALKRWKAKR